MLGSIPPFRWIAAFNATKRKRDRARYIAEWEPRPPDEKQHENAFFARCKDDALLGDFWLKLNDRVDDYERRAEAFLTLASSGGLIFLATVLGGSEHKSLGWLAYSGAACLVLTLVLVAILKIQQIQIAYFRMGEWDKNRRDFIHKKITKGELAWRTVRSYRLSKAFVVTALIALVSTIVGFVLIAISFSPPASTLPKWLTVVPQALWN